MDEEVSHMRRRWLLGALVLAIPVIVFAIAIAPTAVEYAVML